MVSYSVHVRDAKDVHTHTVIMLHGRGSQGDDFEEELGEGRTSAGLTLFEHFPGVRWVFPSAPWGQWFTTPSLRNINLNQHLQVKGLCQSVQFVQGVVQDEIQRVGSSDKVVLGGISQGEATALHVLLWGITQRLGGFVGVSGWMPFADQVLKAEVKSVDDISKLLRDKLGVAQVAEVSHGIKDMPVFLGHGKDDEVVDIRLGSQVRTILEQLNAPPALSWNEYEGAELDGHWIKVPEELDDIVNFLRKAFLLETS